MLVCRLIENSKIELRLHEWYGSLVEAHEKPAACMLHAKKVIVVRLVCYAYTWPHGLPLLLCEKSAITFSTYIA